MLQVNNTQSLQQATFHHFLHHLHQVQDFLFGYLILTQSSHPLTFPVSNLSYCSLGLSFPSPNIVLFASSRPFKSNLSTISTS